MRINPNYAYLYAFKHHIMKNRLNITIDNLVMEGAKSYATRHNTSVSQLVENYLRSITSTSPKKENILSLVDKLPKAKGKVPAGDLNKVYQEERKNKYGF